MSATRQRHRFTYTVIGLLFTGLGGLITTLMVMAAVSAAKTYAWPETTCEIIAAEAVVPEEPEDTSFPYQLTVHYRYEVDGAVYESRRYQHGYSGSDDISETERLADRLRRDGLVPCWVNPDDPESAMLARPGLAIYLFTAMPLAFGLLGLYLLYAAWGPTPDPRAPGRSAAGRSARRMARRVDSAATGIGCLLAFFGLFLFVGLGSFSLFFGLPAWRTWKSKSWTETVCEIERSRVESHTGDDSTTYSIDVLYNYEIDGRSYRSNRHSFFDGTSSSEYQERRDWVDAHPPDTLLPCWIDPDDPHEAVLVRHIEPSHYLALVTLLFAVVGLGGILWVLGPIRRKANRRGKAVWSPAARRGGREASASYGAGAGPTGSQALESKHSPLAKLGLGLFFCILWNGLTGAFVFIVVRSFQQGNPEWFVLVVITPFVLVGLLLIVGVVHAFLALFNPRPKLELGRRSLHLGESTEASWSIDRTGRIHRLTLTLTGQEKVTYRQGTNTRTDTQVFHSQTLVDTDVESTIRYGSATLEIPADTMHSFDATNNQIEWILKLQGYIGLWPDVSEEFVVEVLPAATTGGPAWRG